MKGDPKELCLSIRNSMTLVRDYAEQAISNAREEDLTPDLIDTLSAICRAAGTLAISTATYIDRSQGD